MVRARRLAALALPVAGAAALGACANLGYYGQAIDGHLELMAARRPLDEAIADPATPQADRDRLTEARAIRDYAVAELALPDGESYRSYVALDRRYVVWNVVAAPELAIAPRTWCFPVAGCVAYRGYFDEADARAYGAELATTGLDVYVGGARAYSTLGWFDDPLLSTMLSERPYDLAGVIFHELAHERVYVSGDSRFNEAYAVVVERAGVRRWLRSQGREALLAEYERSLTRRAGFTRAVLETRAALETLYASGESDADKRTGKAAAVAALRARLQAIAEAWGRAGALAAWTEGEINNARLALVATYHAQVPDFERILSRLGGDLAAFHAEVERVSALPADERARVLTGS